MFSERHPVSLLKAGDCERTPKLVIQRYLENLVKEDQGYIKFDVQVPADIRKETILWMMTQTHGLGLLRNSFYKAVDRYDGMCKGETSDDRELHKLVGLAALHIEDTIVLGIEAISRRQWVEEVFPIAPEEVEELEKDFAKVEQWLLEGQENMTLDETADEYLDEFVYLLGPSTESTEENETVSEMREVLDLCIVENRYRMHSLLALAAGVYFWYARGAQAPWLHFLSSMCPGMLEAIDFVAPKVKIANRHPREV